MDFYVGISWMSLDLGFSTHPPMQTWDLCLLCVSWIRGLTHFSFQSGEQVPMTLKVVKKQQKIIFQRPERERRASSRLSWDARSPRSYCAKGFAKHLGRGWHFRRNTFCPRGTTEGVLWGKPRLQWSSWPTLMTANIYTFRCVEKTNRCPWKESRSFRCLLIGNSFNTLLLMMSTQHLIIGESKFTRSTNTSDCI